MTDYLYETSVLNRTKDACLNLINPTDGTFKFGGADYNQITVCANGYIIPGQAGTPETAPPMVNGGDFDNPATPVLAVGLIEIDRDDGLFDFDCVAKGKYATHIGTADVLCSRTAISASSLYDATITLNDISTEYYYINPIFGAGAAKSNIVLGWKAATNNMIAFDDFFKNDGFYPGIKSVLFSGAGDSSGNFEAAMINNVMSRTLNPVDFHKIGTLSPVENFTPLWGYAFTWYKVTQPPEIIDHYNTFQLALACSGQSSDQSLAEKCVALFDYFEIGYSEQNGDPMRVGATGPGLS